MGRYVSSRSTLETMQTAQRNARIPLDQPAVFKRQKDPHDGPNDDPHTDSFFLMMGTDFISNQGFMLKDHWQVRIFLVGFFLLVFSSFGEMNTLGWSFHFLFLFFGTSYPLLSNPICRLGRLFFPPPLNGSARYADDFANSATDVREEGDLGDLVLSTDV